MDENNGNWQVEDVSDVQRQVYASLFCNTAVQFSSTDNLSWYTYQKLLRGVLLLFVTYSMILYLTLLKNYFAVQFPSTDAIHLTSTHFATSKGTDYKHSDE